MDNMSLYIMAIIILCFVCAIFSLIGQNKTKKKNNVEYVPPKISTNEFYLPYRKKLLLTKTEYYFYKQLKIQCDLNDILICPKIRLEDLAEVTTKQDYMRYRGYIKSRHVDFILCDKNLNILCAIELDDNSHNNIDRMQVDNFKNNFFRTIGIPLYRIKTFTNYNDQISVIIYNSTLNQQTLNQGVQGSSP